MSIHLSSLTNDQFLSAGDVEQCLKHNLGLPVSESTEELDWERAQILRYINLRLIAQGLPTAMHPADTSFAEISSGLLKNYHEKIRLLDDHRCPADRRIETELQNHFADQEDAASILRLPNRTFVLDRHGMARELSLPANGDQYISNIVQSYRVSNGVLHNPKHDRRTTKGTFHVVEGSFPIAGDKRAVPRHTFLKLFKKALHPPEELLDLPFTSNMPKKTSTWVSLLIRPLVCPEVPGVTAEKRMETRFFAPGTLTGNLDFVESIFGNAGDPDIPENDAGLDVEHWTGHTGCVILAPHLTKLTKKYLGLPSVSQATERQKRDGMCWSTEWELYNDGLPFKVTCRTPGGAVVTLIADNYFGYCKKEVKTQISFAANLFGGMEEEHAGGALAFPSYNLGDEFQVNSVRYNGRTFADVARDYPEAVDVQPEGYGIDRHYPDLVYIPEDAFASLKEQRIRWERNGKQYDIPLLPKKVYIAPSGYQLRMEKHPAAPSWRIVGTAGEGAFCHKPCTVSGGGKSEISKSLRDYMHYGPIFVSDFDEDMEVVQKIFDKDYSNRWKEPWPDSHPDKRPSRKLLDPTRSVGSVIKLLTPSPDYTDEYNDWLSTIPDHIYAIVFIIKRFYKPQWGDDWKSHFGVDIVNGLPGHELKYRDRALVSIYLRVGLLSRSMWRTYKVRQDFIPSVKIQTEDDISASVVVPGRQVHHLPHGSQDDSYKFLRNCEYRLFQRPDDAIHRGLDKQTERDLSRHGNFISNFEPLSRQQVQEMTEYVVDFDAFSIPMQNMLREAVNSGSSYVVCSANPRQIDGKPTKNPRYLQIRPDLDAPMESYVAEMGTRLWRGISAKDPVYFPVNAVLSGRRNNPPDPAAGIRSLAVYNPLHYQDLPELFMDYICSLTGKSPSTTGAGSEGALTKGPFNMLRPAADLNSAFVSYLLTGLGGFSTAAGHIGPHVQVDHDISLLIPEIWCRLTPEERRPEYLIERGLLEKLDDYEHNGRPIPQSRLGYRINYEFLRLFFGRVFDNPGKVFDEAMLKPETQDPDSYADGILYIAEAHERVARLYIDDGTIEELCPPLQILLTIMAEGTWEGRTIHDPELRGMFSRDAMLASDWYRDRLIARQQQEVRLWQRHVEYLNAFMSQPRYSGESQRLNLLARREHARQQLQKVSAPDYVKSLVGTIGAQPLPALLGQTPLKHVELTTV
jgi:hypothetical protein